MKKQALVLGALVALAACDGFKEAMTAHVDVVARAGSQELSVNRLADLLWVLARAAEGAEARSAPPSRPDRRRGPVTRSER